VSFALQAWTDEYCQTFDRLPHHIQEAIQKKVDAMGRRLAEFPHQKLQGRPGFRLRVGDYRVIYRFDLNKGRIFLLYVGNRREVYR